MKRFGFTLLELLIVVVVVAILASVALSQFSWMIEKSKTVEATRMLQALRTAQLIYHQEHGVYEREGPWNDPMGLAITMQPGKNFYWAPCDPVLDAGQLGSRDAVAKTVRIGTGGFLYGAYILQILPDGKIRCQNGSEPGFCEKLGYEVIE